MELTPDREQARQNYRQRIMDFIAGLAICSQIEKPMHNIGYDESEQIS